MNDRRRRLIELLRRLDMGMDDAALERTASEVDDLAEAVNSVVAQIDGMEQEASDPEQAVIDLLLRIEHLQYHAALARETLVPLMEEWLGCAWTPWTEA